MIRKCASLATFVLATCLSIPVCTLAAGADEQSLRAADREQMRIIVKPAPGSELGQRYPGRVLDRRFTNVFLYENGRWRFLARQATIVSTTPEVAKRSRTG